MQGVIHMIVCELEALSVKQTFVNKTLNNQILTMERMLAHWYNSWLIYKLANLNRIILFQFCFNVQKISLLLNKYL